jgi:beta-lactamase superfamily II metal-dependent hydrolase
MALGYEIIFLPVGDASKSGDAIALRYGNLWGGRDDQVVVVIDGGTRESGDEVVRVVRSDFGTSWVNIAISTHPHIDHTAGLEVVLGSLGVSELWMHRPWLHSDAIKAVLDDGRRTTQGIRDRLRDEMVAAHCLEALAIARKTRIVEPFAGVRTLDGALLVLGPTCDYYRNLLCEIIGASDPVTSSIDDSIRGAISSIYGIKAELEWLQRANWSGIASSLAGILGYGPTLDAAAETTAANDSSVILLLSVGGQRVLFTADAGVPSLTRAFDLATAWGVQLSDLALFQVPHHGSRNNLTSHLLNRISGRAAVVSAATEATPTHPAPAVVNAMIARGWPVYATRGRRFAHWHNAPVTAGYSTPVPLRYTFGTEHSYL